jgi:drug/metabolite transporter (DMT)-like permease
MQQTFGILLVLLSSSCVGFGSVLAKLIMRRLDSWVLGLFRSLFGLLFSIILFWGIGEWESASKVTPQFLGGTIVNAIFYFLASYFYLKAVQAGNVSTISPVTQSHPLFVFLLAAIFLQERITFLLVIGSIITICGIMIIAAVRDRNPFNGKIEGSMAIAPALGCAVSTAIFIVITKYIVQYVSPLTINIVQMFVTLIGFWIITTIVNESTHISGKTLSLIAVMSFVTYIVGNIAYYQALSIVSSVVASPILTTSMIFGSLFGVIFLKETLTTRHLIGTSTAFIGVVIISININN